MGGVIAGNKTVIGCMETVKKMCRVCYNVTIRFSDRRTCFERNRSMRKILTRVLSLAVVAAVGFGGLSSTATVHAENGQVTRIYGETRFETSYAIADAMKEQSGAELFSTVIVASGMNYPDALAGSYLAARKDAPILMVNGENPDSIAALKSYINRSLSPDGTVYILGGTAAVSEAVEIALQDYEPIRLSGADRYDTNLAILQEAGVEGEEILVCTGRGFADSLSGSATGLPILLTGETLSEDQKAFLESVQDSSFVIAGGTNAVSGQIEEQIGTYGDTERISGATRYETSVMLAEWAFADAREGVVAYAWNFPDGLCGGPLACQMEAPLILSGANMTAEPAKEQEAEAAQAAMAYTARRDIHAGVVLGGRSVLTDYTAKLIFGLEDSDQLTDQPYAGEAEPLPEPEEKVVVLDPGHGKAGSGAKKIWDDFIIDEAVINFAIATYTKEYLEENYENVTVYMTKTTLAENPSLSARVMFAVDKEADVLVSQHVNSAGGDITTASGVLTIVPTVDETHAYHKEVALGAQTLGREILDELVLLGWKDRGFLLRLSGDGTRYPDGSLADYYGIVKKSREEQIPGIIVEHGFCNNLNDAKMLADPEMLKKMGEADGKGIADYLDLQEKHVHVYGAGVVTTEPTCTEAGVMAYTCTLCPDMKTEEIQPLGHTRSSEATLVQTAKLYQYGLKLIRCGVCEETCEEILIPGIEDVSLDTDRFVYDGMAKLPVVTVKDEAGDLLQADTDYTVICPEECTEAGSYEIQILFTGDYEGSVTLTFVIEAPAIDENIVAEE